MTILTKPFADKKPEKLLTLSQTNRPDDPEQGDNVVLVSGPPTRRRISASTVFLFMSALTVLCLGIMTGLSIYRSYGRAQMQRLRFHGFCGVPYDSNTIDNDAMIYMNNKWRSESETPTANELTQVNHVPEDYFFKEEFELDLSDDESYSKITVPEFRDGRSGRFLHDFKFNQSTIIDSDNNRCFVMALDRDTTLAPKSMYDLLHKMWSGYYNIDTDVVRKNMRVVLPAVTDMDTIAPRIASECQGMKIFMLEKYVSGVFKRSADLTPAAKFAEFAGVRIVHFNIVNYKEFSDSMDQQ